MPKIGRLRGEPAGVENGRGAELVTKPEREGSGRGISHAENLPDAPLAAVENRPPARTFFRRLRTPATVSETLPGGAPAKRKIIQR